MSAIEGSLPRGRNETALIRVFSVVLVAASFAGGIVLLIAPRSVALLVALTVLGVLAYSMAKHLPLWGILLLVPLTGYVVLNYGFANLALRTSGLVLPVGHLFAVLALVLAVQGRSWQFREFLREPAVGFWLLLALLSIVHLLFNVPQYGAYALRDANLILEGVFLLLGYLWARHRAARASLLRVLALLFVLNLLYALSFPFFSALLVEISPVSGIFLHDVPLLGYYAHQPLMLLAGVFYFLLVGGSALRIPRLAVIGLSLLQVAWSFVFQMRSIYVAVPIALAALAPFTGVRRTARIAASMGLGLALLLLSVAVLNVELPGRVSIVSPEFILEHVKSILLAPGTPAGETARWRVGLVPEAIQRWSSKPLRVLIGEGFGLPLIQFELAGGVLVRQPHNTLLSVLMRLGVVGLVLWVLMNAQFVRLLLTGVRRSTVGSPERGLFIWLVAYFTLAVVTTTVQPWLEFSYGAIPFYMFMGLGMGLKRVQEPLSASRSTARLICGYSC